MKKKIGGGEMELTGALKERYQVLLAEKEKLDKEIRGIESYLKAIGELAPKKRGRKPKEKPE